MLNEESKSRRENQSNTGNKICESGVRALSKALKSNTTLTTLNLESEQDESENDG